MTVTRKVLVVLLTSLLSMVLLVGLGAVTLMWVADRKDDVVERDSRLVMDAHRLNAAVAERGVAVRNYLLVGDERYIAEIDEADEHYGEALAGLRLRAHTDETRRLLESIEDQVVRVNRENEDLIGDRREGRLTPEVAGELLEARVRPIRQDLTNTVDQLVALEEGMITDAVRSSDAAVVNGRRLLVSLGALITVATLVVGVRLTRNLSRSLTGMALTIEAASAEIVAGTAQQVSGATQQAASVQQTVATTDELAQTAEQSSRWARTVADRAKETAEEVRGGSAAVQDSMGVMEEIRCQVDEIATTVVALAERAQDISGIVATVDEIADQVHLLGLNAAIEAARAGEHGRGFAVVAGEVRALADQSRRATVQISDILGEIQQRTNRAVIATEDGGRSVTKGVDRMQATGDTIDRMAEASAAAAIAAEQISASSAQQAVATAQISQAMRDLDSVTQQSAAAARQVEDSAAGLNEVAVDLKSLVGAG